MPSTGTITCTSTSNCRPKGRRGATLQRSAFIKIVSPLKLQDENSRDSTLPLMVSVLHESSAAFHRLNDVDNRVLIRRKQLPKCRRLSRATPRERVTGRRPIQTAKVHFRLRLSDALFADVYGRCPVVVQSTTHLTSSAICRKRSGRIERCDWR